ncbi:MAG: hypothetical protein M3Q14_01660 [bacterium]|nr:hypothetical protein [bacterium]
MHKRKIHHHVVKLRAIPLWTFLAVTLILLVVGIFALRANNQKMIELRAAVFAADEQDGDIEGALQDLREHVYGHMNTNLAAGDNAIKPPIQLKYHYERLVLAEQKRLDVSNETIYTDAQNHCEEQISTGFSGSNRLDCIRNYIEDRGVKQKQVKIPDDLYKFDFASARWSFDLAGWSFILAAMAFVMFCLRLLSELILKQHLAKHH